MKNKRTKILRCLFLYSGLRTSLGVQLAHHGREPLGKASLSQPQIPPLIPPLDPVQYNTANISRLPQYLP